MSGLSSAAWLAVGAYVVASGTAKLPPRRAEETRAALARQGRIVSPASVRGAAVAEVAFGLGVLLGSGRVGTISAGGLVVLLGGYTVLVAQMLRSGAESGCGCHGDRGGRTTTWTLARNVALTTCAVLVLARSLHGDDLPSLLGALVPPLLGPVVLAGSAPAVVLLAHLVLRAREGVVPAAPSVHVEPLPADPDDYVRWPIPPAPLYDVSGRRLSLPDLSRHGARLLLLLDAESTGRSELVLDWLATTTSWEPQVTPAVLVVAPEGFDDVRLPAPTFQDRTGAALAMLGSPALPAAVLLGADGWLAGGPAAGGDGVTALIDLVSEELRLSRARS